MTVEAFAPAHEAQVISCLKALQMGLFINFHVALLRDGTQRLVMSR